MLFQKKSRLNSKSANEDDPAGTIFESFSATVEYLPNGSLPKTKITASFQQFMKLQGATALNPTLAFSAMIPDDALIFESIRANDVSGIRRLLEEGVASLSDCDLKGRSLLYV